MRKKRTFLHHLEGFDETELCRCIVRLRLHDRYGKCRKPNRAVGIILSGFGSLSHPAPYCSSHFGQRLTAVSIFRFFAVACRASTQFSYAASSSAADFMSECRASVSVCIFSLISTPTRRGAPDPEAHRAPLQTSPQVPKGPLGFLCDPGRWHMVNLLRCRLARTSSSHRESPCHAPQLHQRPGPPSPLSPNALPPVKARSSSRSILS